MKWLKDRSRETHAFICGDFQSTLWMCSVAFGILIVIGLVIGFIKPSFAQDYVDRFIQQVEDMGIQLEDGSISASMLFSNNVQAAFSAVIYGFIPFVKLPALALGVNAIMLGAFASYYLHNGISLVLYLASLIPHGIFEIPAIIYAIALGIYLCDQVNTRLRTKKKGLVFKAWFDISRVLVFRVIPLLLMASLVEAYITPVIAGLFS